VKISEVQIAPIKPQGGLVAFASFVIENALYCGSVGIITRPSGGFRLLYPTKAVAGRQIDVFHPISGEAGKHIERVVLSKYEEVMNYGRNRHDNPNTLTD
jgi:DNA-binding cell septation regulator SpoVG